MTYDQWKTTDPSQEGDVCPCGSGEWAHRVYSKEYGVPPRWACEACEAIADWRRLQCEAEEASYDLDATLARINDAINEE
jgi:hypothetical protein